MMMQKKTLSLLENYLKEYKEYLEIEKNRSLLTVENYDRYITRFLRYASKQHGVENPEAITSDIVRKYRLYLNRLANGNAKQEKLSASTQNYHVIAVRGFLKYLAKRDVKSLSAEKIDVGKNPTKQVDFLDPEEVERLLSSANGDDIASLRDRAFLELLFSTGLRVSELVSLDREHINLEKQQFSIRGKGGKVRIVFISETAKIALERYIDRRTDIDPALFIRFKVGTNPDADNSSLRLTSRSVQRAVKKYATRAGIVKEVHPHTLRHSFATDLLQNGADIRSVQALLGHQNITTTQIYTHVTDKGLREIHQKFHGKKIDLN